MRYDFVGKKSLYYGKTLWEIVANLKNFGVGRLVKRSLDGKTSEAPLFKILKVQPVGTQLNQFENRSVIVTVEDIFQGNLKDIKTNFQDSHIPRFQLIPKIEEEKYLLEMEKSEPNIMYIQTYCSWPPLYKKLLEKENLKNKEIGPIPKLKCLNEVYPGFVIVKQEETLKQKTCSLYKEGLSVHEIYQEIVQLKKLIKDNADSQEK